MGLPPTGPLLPSQDHLWDPPLHPWDPQIHKTPLSQDPHPWDARPWDAL